MSPATYGYGLQHSAPDSLVIEIACGSGGSFVNFSNQYIDRRSYKQTRVGNTGRVSATFEVSVPAGGGYDIHGNQEIHVYSTTDLLPGGAYNRYHGGYLGEVRSTVDGGEKKWSVTTNDYGILLDNPEKQITVQWPAGDGTPVINQTIASGLTAGTGVNFTIPDPKDIYVGKKVFAANADGTNTERITISAISGRTATADFAWNKSANWVLSGGLSDKNLIKDGWQQLSTAYTTSTTVVTPGSRTVTLVDTCASMGITNGTLVYCLDPGGTNAEMVTAGSVGTNTFTATFSQSHVVNWHARPMVSYAGLLDEYYNNAGQPMSTNAVAEVILSLPHLSWSDCKPRKVLEDIRALATDYGASSVSTTVPLAVVSTGSKIVTPVSMAGIYVGQVLLVSNSDGVTNREYVIVTAVNHTTGKFTAFFNYTKTANWLVADAPHAPDFFVQVIQDNAGHTALWTPQLSWFDKFDPANLTSINLGDFASPSASQDRYGTYNRTLNPARQITKQDVYNPDTGARGSYEDTATSALLGRTISGQPLVIQDPAIQTNADATARAKDIVQKFRSAQEVIDQVESYHQISQSLFYQGLTASWTHTVEGGTPAIYAVTGVTLDFPEGVARYTYSLGDAVEELGDKPIPTYGSGGITRDTNPPERPTWNSGSGWIISEVYNPATGLIDLTIQCNINGELDLQSVWFYYTTNLNGYWRFTSVQAVGGQRTAQVTLSLPINTLYYFKAYAVDQAQNVSPSSDVVNHTTSGVQAPPTPSTPTLVFNTWRHGTILVRLSTVSGGGSTVGFLWTAHIHGIGSTDFTQDTGSSTIWEEAGRFIANRTYDVTVQAYDSHGNLSASSAAYTFTAGPSQPHEEIYNPNFAVQDLVDATQADGWTAALVGAGFGERVNTSDQKGLYTYHMRGATGDSVTLTGESIAVFNPVSGQLQAYYQLNCATTYKADAAVGTLSFGLNWLDGSGTLLSTSWVFTGTPALTPTVPKIINGRLIPPTGAVQAQPVLKYAGAGLTNTNIYWGTVDIREVLSGNSITPAFALPSDTQIQGGGGSAILDGTAGMKSIGQNAAGGAGTQIPFYGADGITEIGELFSYDNGVDPAQVRLFTSSGTPLNLQPNGASSIVVGGSNTELLVETTGGFHVKGYSTEPYLMRLEQRTANANALLSVVRQGGTGAFGDNLFVLDQNAGLPVLNLAWADKSAAFTPDDTATFYNCDASGGAYNVTLPNGTALSPGRLYVFKKADSSANAVTIKSFSTDFIEGFGSGGFVLNSQYDAVAVVKKGDYTVGGGWRVLWSYSTPGNAARTGTYNSAPSASSVPAGTLYLPTDSVYPYLRSDGSAWHYFKDGYEASNPGPVSFSWDNQGTSTVDTTRGGVFIQTPGNANSLRVRYKSKAYTTPYSLIGVFSRMGAINHSAQAGILFRESATGKIMTCAMTQNGNFSVDKWTNSTTFSVNAKTDGLGLGETWGSWWYRIRDDGSKLFFDYSTDFGRTWLNRMSESRGVFFTVAPDQVGIFANDANSGTPETVWCWHFAEFNS